MDMRMLIRRTQLNEAIKSCRDYHGETSTNEAIFSIGANFTGFDHFIDFCESLATSYCNCETDEDLLEFIQGKYDEDHVLVTYELCLMISDELQEFESVADGFAEMCSDTDTDYDSQEEWQKWVCGFEHLTVDKRRRIIDMWTAETKEQYRRR